MKFSRLATADDFRGYKVEYDHYREMGSDVKELIEKDLLRQAIMLFAKQNGKGLAWSKGYCLEYQKYVFAERDFEEGKAVFVNY